VSRALGPSCDHGPIGFAFVSRSPRAQRENFRLTAGKRSRPGDQAESRSDDQLFRAIRKPVATKTREEAEKDAIAQTLRVEATISSC